MGLIDSIQIPRDMTTDEEYEIREGRIDSCSYYKECNYIFESSMKDCKRYYTQISEALFIVASYIVNYDRAIESIEYSIKQLRIALDKSKELTDENLHEIRNNFEIDIEKMNSLITEIEKKREGCQELLDALNIKAKDVIRVNNILDNKCPWR